MLIIKVMKFALLIVCLITSPAFSRESGRVIPYPPGTDTKTEGASSAPAGINHRLSIYFDTLTDYFDGLTSNEHRVILSHYPTYQQTRENTCGPPAGLTVLYYYGVTDYDEAELAIEMNTQSYPIGTSPKDMLAFFERIVWETDSSLTHSHFDTYYEFKNFVLENLRQRGPIKILFDAVRSLHAA